MVISEIYCFKLVFPTVDKVLEEEVARIMQLVMDCNTMAEELEKPVEFKTKLLSAQARGQETGRTEVYRLMIFCQIGYG